jgi:hypothetical protein
MAPVALGSNGGDRGWDKNFTSRRSSKACRRSSSSDVMVLLRGFCDSGQASVNIAQLFQKIELGQMPTNVMIKRNILDWILLERNSDKVVSSAVSKQSTNNGV